MSRLRIGIDGSLACSARPTGVEHFARSLLNEVVRLEPDRVRWFVYLPPNGAPPADCPAGVVVRHRPDVNTLIKRPWIVAQSWRDRLDVFYGFGHLPPPAGARGRIVITVHDLAFDRFPDCYPPGAPATAHAQVADACRRAGRVVVPSEATRADLVSAYGMASERVDVILEGGRSVFQPGEPGPLPERVKAAGICAPFALTVGRIDRRKNVGHVIDAYRRLLRDGVAIGGLVIVGPDDTGSEDVRRRLAGGATGGMVDGEKIVLTGYLGEDELVGLYRAAALLVYPSRAEGFGLPVLEAMACGTPVVTSNVSSLPEVAGEAALLVDPESVEAIAGAMREVLSSAELRGELRAVGLARAAELTWGASARRLARSLLAAGGIT